jgi:acyl-CoA dehydrogenase
VDFAPSPKAQDYLDRLQAFMDERVFPAEEEYERQLAV